MAAGELLRHHPRDLAKFGRLGTSSLQVVDDFLKSFPAYLAHGLLAAIDSHRWHCHIMVLSLLLLLHTGIFKRQAAKAVRLYQSAYENARSPGAKGREHAGMGTQCTVEPGGATTTTKRQWGPSIRFNLVVAVVDVLVAVAVMVGVVVAIVVIVVVVVVLACSCYWPRY